ncbi:MAG: hypothetical protein AB9903_33985 [Vulcanimicrobiota bacterium]
MKILSDIEGFHEPYQAMRIAQEQEGETHQLPTRRDSSAAHHMIKAALPVPAMLTGTLLRSLRHSINSCTAGTAESVRNSLSAPFIRLYRQVY